MGLIFGIGLTESYRATQARRANGRAILRSSASMGRRENEYWQTLKDRDRGSWCSVTWVAARIQSLKIGFAHTDKIHSPPARIVVRISPTERRLMVPYARSAGGDSARRQPYPASRHGATRCVCQPSTLLATGVPRGSQPNAKYPGYVCLGEVENQCPICAAPGAIEGHSGRRVRCGPALAGATSLARFQRWVRNRSGASRRAPWPAALHLLVDGRGVRHESRSLRPKESIDPRR